MNPVAHAYRVTKARTDNGVLRKVEAVDKEGNVLCEMIVTGLTESYQANQPGTVTIDVYATRVEHVVEPPVAPAPEETDAGRCLSQCGPDFCTGFCCE